MTQGPNQIPSAVVLWQSLLMKVLWLFPTGTYAGIGTKLCRVWQCYEKYTQKKTDTKSPVLYKAIRPSSYDKNTSSHYPVSPGIQGFVYMSPVSPIFHIVLTVNSWSQTCFRTIDLMRPNNIQKKSSTKSNTFLGLIRDIYRQSPIFSLVTKNIL